MLFSAARGPSVSPTSASSADDPEEEKPLGIGSEGVLDSLRKSQLHLLVMDNEERGALVLEIDDGEDAGTAGTDDWPGQGGRGGWSLLRFSTTRMAKYMKDGSGNWTPRLLEVAYKNGGVGSGSGGATRA